jgi:uncharacterized protein
MKYVVLLIVLVVAIGVWRSRRRSEEAASQAQSRARSEPPGGPLDIVACAHCGTHVPRTEALMLGSQPYCSPEHRQEGAA